MHSKNVKNITKALAGVGAKTRLPRLGGRWVWKDHMKNIIIFIFILLLLIPVSALSQGTDASADIVAKEKTFDLDKQNSTSKNQESANHHESISSLTQKSKAKIYSNIHAEPLTNETTTGSNDWNASDILMVIFTAILAICTYGLWRATKKIVEVTEQTSKRQLRAYVAARLADGEKLFLDENNCLSVPLIIENHGQTPAHNFRQSTFVNILKFPIESVLDPPEYEGGSVSSLFPGQKTRMYPTLPRPLNSSEINSIKNKEGCFCVWGYLEYVDIFSTVQTSEFRMYSTGSDLERGELAYCEEGNNAT